MRTPRHGNRILTQAMNRFGGARPDPRCERAGSEPPPAFEAAVDPLLGRGDVDVSPILAVMRYPRPTLDVYRSIQPYSAFLCRSAGGAGFLSLSFSEGTTPDSGTVTVDWAVSVGPTIPDAAFLFRCQGSIALGMDFIACRAGCARSGTGPGCRRSPVSPADRRSPTLSAIARRTNAERVAHSGDRRATRLFGR